MFYFDRNSMTFNVDTSRIGVLQEGHYLVGLTVIYLDSQGIQRSLRTSFAVTINYVNPN